MSENLPRKKEEIITWILWWKECGLVIRAQGAGSGIGLDFNNYSLWLQQVMGFQKGMRSN